MGASIAALGGWRLVARTIEERDVDRVPALRERLCGKQCAARDAVGKRKALRLIDRVDENNRAAGVDAAQLIVITDRELRCGRGDIAVRRRRLHAERRSDGIDFERHLRRADVAGDVGDLRAKMIGAVAELRGVGNDADGFERADRHVRHDIDRRVAALLKRQPE